jgi:hypothetical protein
MVQWNFRYLAARPELVEGQRLIFSQLPGMKGGFLDFFALLASLRLCSGQAWREKLLAFVQSNI